MKQFISGIFLTLLIFGAAFIISRPQDNDFSNTENSSVAVTIIDGRQNIEIFAKGGYAPSLIQAQSGIPTTLNVKTQGTYDCSSALRIPSLGYQTYLPPSGTTQIEIQPQQPGSVLKGTCSMGMYNFAIKFE